MYFKTLLVQQNKCKVQTFVICPAETQEKMCLNYKISPCLKLILNKISSIQHVNMKCTPNYTTDHTQSKKNSHLQYKRRAEKKKLWSSGRRVILQENVKVGIYD